MTPAERDRIAGAARAAAQDAPPLPSEALEMMRRDHCPASRKSDRGAA